MLELNCNAIELLRLRQELMMCISECHMLEQLLGRQSQLSNLQTLKALYAEGLVFEHGLLEPD